MTGSGKNSPSPAQNGFSPFLTAILRDDAETVCALVAGGQDINAIENHLMPIHHAAGKGSIKVLRALVALGADVNAVSPTDPNRHTPLHLAATHGRTQTISALASFGADTKTTDKRGWTPLHTAIWGYHEDAARVLIHNGASVTAQNNDGQSVIDLARRTNKPKILAELLEEKSLQHARQTHAYRSIARRKKAPRP